MKEIRLMTIDDYEQSIELCVGKNTRNFNKRSRLKGKHSSLLNEETKEWASSA